MRVCDLPETEVDRCLAVIAETTCGKEVMEYLLASYSKSSEYRAGVDAVARDICQAICDNRIKRWDFDPLDNEHKDQKKSAIETTWVPPKKYSRAWKSILLENIVGAFRQGCHRLVKELINKFLEARTTDDTHDIIQIALEYGVFMRLNGVLVHNHSFVSAKDAYDAYLNAP